MSELASGRQPLFLAMRGAADEATRRTNTVALRAFDAPLLADIRRFATSPATRFQHPDATVSDAVLAAIQLEVIANAEGDLADPAEAHERSWRAAGMAASFDWCGFFAMENYMQSNLDSDLKRGFFHVTNVEHYFTYRYAFGERKHTRVMKWIYAEDSWHDLQEYHTTRGSVRTWIDAAAIEGGGALDIRAGDLVLIDHSGSGAADHIVMVHSFDMTTNTLFTIGGNDGGYEVDTRATHEAPRGETEAAREKRERLEGATGQPLRPGGSGGHVGVGSFDLDDQPAAATLDRDRARRPAARAHLRHRPAVDRRLRGPPLRQHERAPRTGGCTPLSPSHALPVKRPRAAHSHVGAGTRRRSGVQHLAHLARECAFRERLLQERRRRRQLAVALHGLVRVARHEQDPHPRREPAQPLRELRAADLGHHHVGQQQVDGPLGAQPRGALGVADREAPRSRWPRASASRARARRRRPRRP